ncbi:MAG: hypothetical protein F4X72_00175 [Dehalococcoidia bacterium]|nr:hypothetical protein [Dehalococcoidia bacterium]
MALRFSRIVLLSAAVALALVWSAGGDSPTPVSAQTTDGANRPAVTSDPVDGYMVLAPPVLRSGQTEPISVSLFSGQQPARGTVKLTLLQPGTLLAEAEGSIEGTGSIPLSVPRISQGYYYLSVAGPGFQESHPVMVDPGDVLFVETDKPVYNPGQDMRIRVLLMDVELKPLSGDVTVEVQDAKGTRIFRELAQSDEFGMATLSMPISAEPNLGDWKITASYEDRIAQTEVQVERYVLPKYEINVAFPHEWTLFGEPITGTVSAEYSFGKPVRGELKIVASKYAYGWEEFAEFTMDIDGTASFELPDTGYISGGDGPDGLGNISLEVTVQEKATGHVETTTAPHTVAYSTVTLDLIPEGSSFKPTLPFSVLILTDALDESLIDQDVGLETYYFDEGLYVTYSKESRIKTVDGKALITITPPEGTVAVALVADAGDSHASTVLKAAYSPSGSYIHLEQVAGSLEVGDQAQFKAHSTESNGSFFYEVVSRGRVVLSDVSSSPDIGFTVSPVMAGDSKLVVYQVSASGEVSADYLPFHVAPAYPLEIDATFDSDEVRPGDEVRISLSTQGEAKVGLAAVDRSVFLLGDNRVNLQQVFADLERFGRPPEDPYDYYNDDYYESRLSRITTLGAAETLSDAGLVVMTNRTVPAGRTHHKRPQPVTGGELAFAAGAPAPGGSSDLADIQRIRQYFPETWLWTDVMTDDAGSASLTAEAPDSITTWMLRAVGLSKEHGLGIAETQLRVFQPFFLQVDLPPTAIRGEEFSVKVALHNYLDTSQEFHVELEESDRFTLLDDAAKTVTVSPNDLSALQFKIRLTELGTLPLKVSARSTEAADAVIKELFVEPEGVPQEVVTNRILLGGDSEVFPNAMPPGSISGSARTYLALSGNYLSQTLEGLEDLLRMSYGCGEQNMLNFAPNVFVARYLEQTGKLNPELMARIEHLMLTGYQQQLMFQRADGSFSMWGDRDREGSIWLTAFVLKTLAQAQGLIYVDPDVVTAASDWILQHQNDDGSFEQIGGVPNSYLYGGLEGATALAAYVAIALHEAGQTTSADLAIGYLEDQLDGIENPYTMAIVAYALALGESAEADNAHDRLLEMGTRDDNGLYWDASTPQSNSGRAGWATSTAVENTGYAVLALLEHGDSINALDAVRWLVSQRNAYGGYRSTQDTIVGLQALIQHSIVTQNTVDMTVTLTSGDWSEQVTIEAANADIVQVVKVPVGEDIQITTEGGGEAIVQVVHRFNLPEAQAQPVEIFTLDVDYSPDLVTVGDDIAVSATVGFVPPDDLDVGMVVVEVGVPTGFSPDAETLETMASDNPMIRRYDITDRHVVVYLEDLVADETFDLSFAAKAEHVITTQPVTSRVYSYYNPRWRVESLGPSVTVEEVPETTIACIAAVADETNVDLVSDCEALLEARDILAVNASLNWSGDTSISDWEGVTLQGTPQRVASLDLRDMGLHGSIPAELGLLSSLSSLDLRNSGLSGPIPPELGDLANLQNLYLHGNMLDGEIPAELGDMTGLRYLWLHSNELTGEIPEELGDLENLRDLNLHSNSLDGAIPGELGDLSRLTRLRLHRNALSGAIPSELGSLSSLESLWLHGNMLTGSIPAELGELEELERLWLSENELSGPIPQELGELSSLVQWRLAGDDHQFTGCLPAGLASVEDTDIDSLNLDTCANS